MHGAHVEELVKSFLHVTEGRLRNTPPRSVETDPNVRMSSTYSSSSFAMSAYAVRTFSSSFHGYLTSMHNTGVTTYSNRMSIHFRDIIPLTFKSLIRTRSWRVEANRAPNHTLAMMFEFTCINKSENEGHFRIASSVIISITRLASDDPLTTTLGYTSRP